MPPFGDVPSRRAFLRSISDQTRRIGIDNRALLESQSMEEFGPEPVVRGLQTAEFLRTKTKEKASQSISMRKVVQAQQRRNQTVVNQALSVLDATDAGHNRKQVSEKKICGVIFPIVVVGPMHEGLEESPNCKTSAKQVQQAEPSEACKARFSEGKLKFSGSLGHIAQSYLKGRFVQSTKFGFQMASA